MKSEVVMPIYKSLSLFATQESEIKLETNVKLEFDEEIPTLPAPDRITIGDDFIGCIDDIVWMGNKLTFDPENSLSS